MRASLLGSARWSLVPGLSHLLLEGQLGLFGAQPDGLVRAVLEASGLGDAGRPETKVSN